MPSYYFSMFEDKLGIIFACGPAIRQFWAYRCRTNSSLPTRRRQYPNEDFEKMRYRVNLRDIFWYRKAPMVGDRVFDAARIFQHEKPPPDASGNNPKAWSKVKNSILDVWEKKFKSIVGADSEREVISNFLHRLVTGHPSTKMSIGYKASFVRKHAFTSL